MTEYDSRLQLKTSRFQTMSSQLSKSQLEVQSLTTDNAQLRNELKSIKEDNEAILSEKLDIAIKFNALQCELEEEKKLSKMRANALEVGKNLIVKGDTPSKAFVEAIGELEREEVSRILDDVSVDSILRESSV